MGQAGRWSWILVAGFSFLLLVRTLQGSRLARPEDPSWELQVLWHHGGAREALAFAAVLACIASISRAAGGLVRRDAPGSDRPVSLGALVFFAAGLVDAVAGTVLHFNPPEPLSYTPAILLSARSVALAVALPALFLRLRGRGKVLLAPGLVLSLLGVGLWLSTLQRPPAREPDAGLQIRRLVHAGQALAPFRRPMPPVRGASASVRPGPPPEDHSTARRDIERRILESGLDAVDALLDAYGSDEGWTVRLLLQFDSEALPILLRGLRRSNPVSRRRALDALRPHAHGRDVALAVLPLLRDPDPGIRFQAVRFFEEGIDEAKGRTAAALLPEAVEPLRTLLRDRSDSVRQAAIVALRHQALHAAWPDLRALLRFEPDREVREEAHRTLLKLRNSEAFLLVLQDASKTCSHGGELDWAFKDARIEEAVLGLSDRLPENVLWAFLERGEGGLRLPARQLERLLAAAKGKDVELRRAALGVLLRLDDPRANAACLAALKGADADRVLQGLRRRGLATAKDVMRLFDTRSSALWGCVPGPDDAELAGSLEERLRDPDVSRKQRSVALQLLKEIDKARAERTALSLFEKMPDADLLYHLPAAELLKVLDSPDPLLSLQALRRLGVAEDSRAVRRLVQALRDVGPKEQGEFIRMAERSRVRDAAPLLCEIAARTPLPAGRAQEHKAPHLGIATALGEIGDPSSAATLRELLQAARERDLPCLASAAATALVNAEDRSEAPALLGLAAATHVSGGCACGSAYVCRAARALAGAGEQGAGLLLDAATGADAPAAVIEALGSTRSPDAKERLLGFLAQAVPGRRRAAALGLGRLSDPDTLPALRKAVEDPSPIVREAARWAVQQTTGEDAGLRMSDDRRHTLVATSGP